MVVHHSPDEVAYDPEIVVHPVSGKFVVVDLPLELLDEVVLVLHFLDEVAIDPSLGVHLVPEDLGAVGFPADLVVGKVVFDQFVPVHSFSDRLGFG